MFRLKSGNYLFRGDDGYCYFVDSREKAARALVPDVLVDRFMRMDPVQDGDTDYQSFIQILKERGLVENTSLPNSQARNDSPVLSVAGDGTVANSLWRMMQITSPSITLRKCLVGDKPDDDTALFVIITGRQQDAVFRELDQSCSERSIPWFRCCREGDNISLSPLSIGKGHAGYSDLRGRRLAASKIGVVLKEMWQKFDQQPVSELNLSPFETSIVAGYLSEIIQRFLNGDMKGVPVDEELCFNLDTLALSRHPVLPLPSNLLVMKTIGED